MGQQHQGEGWIGGLRSGHDALGRGLQGDGAEHGLAGAAEVEPASSGDGTGPHHRQARGMQFPQPPAAMPIPQQLQLTREGAAGGVTAGIVVAEDAGQRERQGSQPLRNARLAVAEVTHHQQGIRGQPFQQLFITGIPLAVQVSGDGDAELGQPDA